MQDSYKTCILWGEIKMRKIKITYEHETMNGNWIRKEYVTDNGKDYERVINIIHSNPKEYRVINVEHI